MALNIKSKETEALVRRLAAITGESLTEAIHKSVDSRLSEISARQGWDTAAWEADVHRLFEEARSAPILDPRPADEILGYNDIGTVD